MRDLYNLVKRDGYDAAGRCPEHKRKLIKELILKNNSQLCVEIGVFKGASLMCFVEALELTNGKIIGIDPLDIISFKNDIPNKYLEKKIYEELFTEQKVLDDIYQNLINLIDENKLNNTVTIIRKTSENAVNLFEINSIDILHIDGNHDYDFVNNDIKLYLPLVRNDGYIIMDDTD